MDASQVVIALLAYSLAREAFFLYTVKKLTDKIMSRNYFDLKTTEAQTKRPRPSAVADFVDQSPHEDFGSITG